MGDWLKEKAEATLDALRDLHGQHGVESATTEAQEAVIEAALREARAKGYAEARREAIGEAAAAADALLREAEQSLEQHGGEEGTPAYYVEGRAPTSEEHLRQTMRSASSGAADAAEEIATRIRALNTAAAAQDEEG